LAGEGPEYTVYLFQTATSPEWLAPLQQRGYFGPDSAPGPAAAKEKGYIYFPLWPILPYLEQVSKRLALPRDKVHRDELFSIMSQVTQYHVDNGRKLDNYRTWWYFVKILLNLPTRAIPEDILELLPVWLDSKFDNPLPGADIAKKLLPKFLGSTMSEDHRKAEKIVQAITAVRCKKRPQGEKKGLFAKTGEADTLVDSYWLEESFKANAKKVGEKCSAKVLFSMADSLKQVFRCEEPEHELMFKHEDKEYAILVTHEIDFEFSCQVQRLLQEKDKDRTLEQKLSEGVEFEKSKVRDFAMHDCRDRTSFVEAIAAGVREVVSLSKLDRGFEEKMGHFYEGILSDYSYIWFPSIESGPEVSVHGAKETLAVLLRDLVQVKAQAHLAEAKRILGAFRSELYQYPLFRRISIFTVAMNWAVLADEFDTMLQETDAAEMFDNPYYEYEMSLLLKKHVGSLTAEQKEVIRRIIDAGPTKWLPDEKQEDYKERWKQKWYGVLKADPEFAELQQRQVGITGVKDQLPTRPVYFETRVGPGPSPLTKDQILAEPNKELVALLASFRTKDRWKDPTVEGLAETLCAAAESEPGKFVGDLTPFLEVGYLYVYYLLFGFRSAWEHKRAFAWDKLFEFLGTYTHSEAFWEDRLRVPGDQRGADHQWVTGMIGELIREGTQDDAWAFPEDLLDDAKRLLFLVLDKEKPEKHVGGDALTNALNSLHGKIITALLFLALRLARLKDKRGIPTDDRWEPQIRERYEALLTEGVVEAYTFLGHYMPNLYYLHAPWMDQRIKALSAEANESLWGAFMEGYLLGPRLYTDLYGKMKANYERGLDYSFKDDHVNRRLVEHIAWRYLDGVEKLDNKDDLFRQLVDRWNVSRMNDAIHFFWGQRDHLAKTPSGVLIQELPAELTERRQRIIDFWKWVYDNNLKPKGSDGLTDEDARILASLSKLTIFLDKIDSEKAEWLMASIPHARMDIGFDAPFFLEYLNDLKDADAETTRHTGRLLKRLAATSAPDFKQEDIHSIVQHLYASGEAENIKNANDICNIYGSKGLHFLRGLWEKHNPPT